MRDDSPDANARFSDSREIAAVVEPCHTPGQHLRRRVILEIVNAAGRVVSGRTSAPEETIVGARVELTVRTNPSGHNVTNVSWQIPGFCVADYPLSGGSSQAPVTCHALRLTRASLSRTTVEFYWIRRTEDSPHLVRVNALVDGVPRSAVVAINVRAPQINRFHADVSRVTVGEQPHDHLNTANAPLHLVFGDRTANNGALVTVPLSPARSGSTYGAPGMRFVAEVCNTTAATGVIMLLQLAHVHRSITSMSGVTWVAHADEYQLDTVGTVALGGAHVAISASGGRNWLASEDSPSCPINAHTSATSAADLFRTYVMFRPSVDRSIWVVLSVMEWRFNGRAGWNGSNWVLMPGSDADTPATGASAPQHVERCELPEWNDRVDLFIASHWPTSM